MLAQAIVERGMLDGISSGMMRIKYAVESRIGEGNAKWLLVALRSRSCSGRCARAVTAASRARSPRILR